MWNFAFAFCLIYVSSVGAFYLPGLAPKNYCVDKEDPNCVTQITVHANRLTSSKTVLPYDYEKFSFCTGIQNFDSVSENFGQIVFGERIVETNYHIDYLADEHCVLLCTNKYYPNQRTFKDLVKAIKQDYQLHFIIDNLPVMFCLGKGNCQNSIPLGCFSDASTSLSPYCESLMWDTPQKDNLFIFNHLSFVIYYHRVTHEKWNIGKQGDRIVRISVNPKSINHGKSLNCKSKLGVQKLDTKGENQIIYSYSVFFDEDKDIKWSSRWDHILVSYPQSKIQWFSIFNSFVIVIFLSGMMALVFLRTLKSDISRYESMVDKDDGMDDFGWKLVHGDVFRPPRYGMLLTIFVGSGFQILCSTTFTFVFACLGFLSPANRGALMTCVMITYMLMGICAGYLSARLYKSFGGNKWKSNVLLTALLAPSIVFGVFFLLNLMFWAYGSSAAVPFTTILGLLALFIFISVPLTFIGSYCGYKAKVMENPVRTNQIPRQIPPQNMHNFAAFNMAFGGLLPFAVIFVQMFFILNSIWSMQFYYMFGLLFVVFLLMVVACVETSIVLCYFNLCSENYHWWWQSFLNGGAISFFLFLYSIHYYVTKTEMVGIISLIVYYSYSFLLCWLFFLTCGTISFLGCLWFIRKIYAIIKVD